jgi:hypothetical protein
VVIDIPDEWRQRIPKLFPQFVEGANFEFASPVDPNYNCLSWALSYNDKYLEDYKGAYWPWKGVPDDTVDGWATVCELHGFFVCDGEHFEPGFEKIAIFEDAEGVSHACRQDKNSLWKSKLGGWGPDIDHADLKILEDGYGTVGRILKRPRPDWNL